MRAGAWNKDRNEDFFGDAARDTLKTSQMITEQHPWVAEEGAHGPDVQPEHAIVVWILVCGVVFTLPERPLLAAG